MSKILLIDDEEANVRVLSMSLRADGHEVVSAYSGEEGVKVFERESPELVLTDIKMPGMDGIEVLQEIKTLQPEAEVIIITGHGDIENAIEALKFGASDFINKPIRDEVLTVAIQRAEEKRHIKRQLKEYTENLEQKVQEATAEIWRKSNFLTKLIRSSNDAIIATDQSLRIVIYNPGAERIFGYEMDEVVDRRNITELLPDDLASMFSIPVEGLQPGAEPKRREITIRSKSGSDIPVQFYLAPLFEKNTVVGSVSFFQDLRDIKRLEGELVAAERLAAIGQTVAGVAHGVKNILHGFKGGSYLVNLGIDQDNAPKLKKGWEMIQRNINRTSELVLDLLSYSKEREAEFRPCQPNAIVEDVCEVMQDVADKNQIALVTDLDRTIGRVVMDRHIIHQCLSNLVSNALDACLFDEDVTKKWQVVIKTTREDERQICFSVQDNGAGMTEEVQSRLFTSFFSTKGHRGTGLGLLVARKSVQEHGGAIEVRSEAGIGTTFTVRMPYGPTQDTTDQTPLLDPVSGR